MIASIPLSPPTGSAILQKVRRVMDVILHIGAHRCATTSFQHCMRSNASRLDPMGVGFWGPIRSRSGLFHGILPGPEAPLTPKTRQRALGRVQLRCAKSVDLGVRQLIVSDENMMGTMRANLRVGELYGGVGERIARFAEAFQGHLTDIVLNIRSPEYYWASVFGLFAEHGRGTPHPGLLRRVAQTPRSWRDVATDVSCAAGGARVHVLPFERFAGRPDAQLAHLIGRPAPGHAAQDKRNTTLPLEQLRRVMSPSEGSLPEGEGRWMPFDDEQRAMLRETYADDLMWLESGAEGLAVLAEDPAHNKAEKHLPSPDKTRGRHHGRHAKVARAG